ncbi:MAG: PQQ-binding-like beta-propeller repeat protein [Verrucomicrobia bacterium]|nr:PQQ-binding-like beta-propeller repeat protein [Verrucomicrobiota bacterium]
MTAAPLPTAHWLLTCVIWFYSFILSLLSFAADWPLARGDAAMTGRSATKLVFPLTLAWSTEIGNKVKKDGVVATPITHDGKVYIGAQNGKFTCLELETGKILWQVEKKGFFEGSAAVVDGLVIAGCGDSFIYAWNITDGSEAWKFETEGEVHAGVNLWKDANGKVCALIGSYDNRLYCLDVATGKKIWGFETTNYINGAVAIYEGQVALGGCDGMLYMLDIKTGKEIKKIEINSYIGNNIAADQGAAYVAHYGNKVAAYSFADTKQLWEFGERDFPYYAAPAVSGNWVVAGSRDKRVYGIDRVKGELKWVFRTRGDVDSSPVICADTHVIFGSNDGFIYAANLADGVEAWRYEIGAPVKTAPAVAGDWVLIGSDDGSVYAFKNGQAK